MSVRGDRVVYRDREVEYDSRSNAGSYLRPEPRDAPYTTRKIYRVPREEEVEREERLTVVGGGSDRRSERGGERGGYSENRVVIRRERTPEPEPVQERREIRIIEREREPEPIPERREIRVIEREREPEARRYERPPEREIRYERDFDRRDDLERYTRTVDYYPRPEPPPPIIIRQEPQQIIIQEAPRAPLVVPAPPKEEDFQLIQRSEIRQTERSEAGSRHESRLEDDRQIARRPKPREEEEEDYYYERRVREVSRDDRSRHDEDRHSRREREVSPGDSISQYGRDRGRGYESDDSYEYIRRETREEYSDEGSPNHRRHLAEGAIAGLGAAEILRHHSKKQGGDEGSRRSRVGKDVGAAALGAIGAEAVTRARSHYREKSKSRRGSRDRTRDRSRDREGRRKHRRDRDRSRSRSQSKPRIKQLAGLGLGAAAVAAAVGYANRQNKKNQMEDRRSRSRTRRHSVDASDEVADDARDPGHRNKKIAQAGLAGAAVAGLVERARSKSRGGDKSRSKSRVRQSLPIAAAGLGSAAIAGLYERNQAGKKEKEARREERHARRERRSRSRSQSAPAYEGARDAPAGDPGLIEYGEQPIQYNGTPQDYYNRPASQQGYYNNAQEAIVPAAVAGAAYGQQRERERNRSASDSGSDGGRRRRRHRRRKSDSRSRSRSRGLATGAAAAGAAALAASEHEKRKQRRKDEKRERRRESS